MNSDKSTVLLNGPEQYIKWKVLMENHFKSRQASRMIFNQEIIITENPQPEALEFVYVECEMIRDLIKSLSDQYTLLVVGENRFVNMWNTILRTLTGEINSKLETLKSKLMSIKFKKSISVYVSEWRMAIAEYRLFQGSLADDEIAR